MNTSTVVSSVQPGISPVSLSLFPQSVWRGILTALKYSRMSECPSFKVGAVIFKNGKFVSGGWNWYRKTHPKSQSRNKGIHAELHCICGLSEAQLRGSILFVARITKKGLAAMAKPCPPCQLLLKNLGLKRIYYTNSDGGIGEFKI